MPKFWHKILAILLLSVLALITCGKEKTPSRDHIPLIKESIARLQQSVLDKSPAAIDSLLSVEILKYHQSSDSLLKFIYGPDGDFAFKSFGQADIVYTDEFAQVECFVQDSTANANRPIVLSFVFDLDLWLLSRFETDSARFTDSL